MIEEKRSEKNSCPAPKCPSGGAVTIVAAIIITAIIAGGVVYVLMSGKTQDDTCEVTVTPTANLSAVAQKTTTSGAVAEDAPNLTNKDFENLVNSSSADIRSTFAESVYYVLESSECCGAVTPEKAETELIKDTQSFAPFDFTEKEQLVKNIKTNKTDLADYKIGIAPHYDAGQIVLVYHLNHSGEIDKIYIAHSAQLDSE